MCLEGTILGKFDIKLTLSARNCERRPYLDGAGSHSDKKANKNYTATT